MNKFNNWLKQNNNLVNNFIKWFGIRLYITEYTIDLYKINAAFLILKVSPFESFNKQWLINKKAVKLWFNVN